jgi:hypothetical protein
MKQWGGFLIRRFYTHQDEAVGRIFNPPVLHTPAMSVAD